MKKYFTHIICFTWAAALAGCKKLAFFESAGTTTTQTHTVAFFNQIKLYDNIDLYLTPDTAEYITVEAGKHLQPYIAATADSNILTIRNKVGAQWLRNPNEKIKVYAHFKELVNLEYAGSGHVFSTDTIRAGTISIRSINGAGNIEVTLKANRTFVNIAKETADFIFHGQSDSCYTYVNARGSIDFSDFYVKALHIDYGSLRDAYVNVSDGLYANMFFKGNLYYKGNPAIIDTTNYSTGRAIKMQ